MRERQGEPVGEGWAEKDRKPLPRAVAPPPLGEAVCSLSSRTPLGISLSTQTLPFAVLLPTSWGQVSPGHTPGSTRCPGSSETTRAAPSPPHPHAAQTLLSSTTTRLQCNQAVTRMDAASPLVSRSWATEPPRRPWVPALVAGLGRAVGTPWNGSSLHHPQAQ